MFKTRTRSLITLVIIILLLINVYKLLRLPDYNTYYYGYRFGLSSMLDVFHNATSIDTTWIESFSLWGQSLTSIPIIGDGLAFIVDVVSALIWGAYGVVALIRFIVFMFTAIII